MANSGIYKTPYRQVNVQLNEATGLASPSNGVVLLGFRNIIPTGDTYFKPLVNQPGYPFIDNYFVYRMPNFTTGAAALSYMQNLGFQVSYGIEGSTVLPAPTNVTPIGNNSVVLTFNAVAAESAGWSEFANNSANYVSTFTQASTDATGVDSSFASSTTAGTVSVTLQNVSDTFNTTNLITVTYVNTSVQIPNAAKTDDICMAIWGFFTTLNNSQPTIINPVIPPLYFAVIPQGEDVVSGYFGPSSSSIALVDPANIVTASDHVDLYWSSGIPENYFMIPDQELGTSYIYQTTSAATGQILETLPGTTGPAGSVCGVRLINVTGTFNATNSLEIRLDASQDVFALVGNTEVGYITNPYEQSTDEDVNETYLEFYTNIYSMNQPLAVNQNKFYVAGVIANVSYTQQEYAELPIINSQYIQAVFYPYNQYKSPAMTISQVTACHAALVSQAGVPFYPVNGSVALGMFPNTTKSQQVSVGPTTYSELIMQQGWTVYSVNQQTGQVYVVRPITTLTEVGSLADIEYYPVTTWQVVGEWKKTIYNLSQQVTYTNAKNSPAIRQQLQGAVQGQALLFGQLTMFEFVQQYIKQFTVTLSLTNPSLLVVNTPAVITPELSAIQFNVSVNSALNVAITSV